MMLLLDMGTCMNLPIFSFQVGVIETRVGPDGKLRHAKPLEYKLF